jgi:hypothetical protein
VSDFEEPYGDDQFDDQFDYDDNKFYFKFNLSSDSWAKWLHNALDDIVKDGWKIPDKLAKSDYMGVNSQGEPIWKKKYFVCDPIKIAYYKHIESHPVHFLQQPVYYKGLYDILN